MGTEPMPTSEVEATDAFSSRMMKMQEEAKAALEHVADKMATITTKWPPLTK
jgi:hypothetical protein